MNILMFNYILTGVMCNYVSDLAWKFLEVQLKTLDFFLFPIPENT